MKHIKLYEAKEPEHDQGYWPDGTLRWDEWTVGLVLHREDGPARIIYDRAGEPVRKEWHNHGTLEREWRRWDSGGTEEWWFNERGLHRDGAPAVIQHRADGSLAAEEWWKDNLLHRDEAPAKVHYWPDGTVRAQGWYKDGEPSREDGPAVITYFLNGKVERTDWCLDGKCYGNEDDWFLAKMGLL